MEKYLIAIDLDGTLLYDWETISEETKSYLKQLPSLGHKIVLATGRPLRSTQPFHRELELDTPIINYNGGLVKSHHDKNFPNYSLTIDRNILIDIFESNKQYIQNAFGEIGDDIYLWKDTEEIQPLLHNFNGSRLFVGEFKHILEADTNGFLVLAKEGKSEYIEEFIKNKYGDKVLSRNWGSEYNFIIELFTPETTKGNGLKYVADYLGFPRHRIIAFGDAHNDIELLEYAGTGIAMANAHESLKAVADVILEYTNKEDGIVK
ncbi:MAG: HAD family hydrolase, partial [Bacilli bacterium]|nr:HAD family hydrolase [Bacilli bacterium]